jgi:hypothetical protein
MLWPSVRRPKPKLHSDIQAGGAGDRQRAALAPRTSCGWTPRARVVARVGVRVMRRFALARGWYTGRSEGGAEGVGLKCQRGGHMGRDRSPGRMCPSGPIRRRPKQTRAAAGGHARRRVGLQPQASRGAGDSSPSPSAHTLRARLTPLQPAHSVLTSGGSVIPAPTSLFRGSTETHGVLIQEAPARRRVG